MKKLAVFDWNGTLFDDLAANLAGANASLKAVNLPPLDIEAYQRTMIFPISDFYYRHGVTPEIFREKHEIIQSAFLETYEKKADECELRDKSIEILQYLIDNGYDCIILSNHFLEEVENRVRRFEIRKYFSEVSCSVKGCVKSATNLNKLERLQIFMQERAYTPEDSFIVGDSLEEPFIAQSLGMKSFSISGGCFDTERLKQEKTNLISCFSELPQRIYMSNGSLSRTLGSSSSNDLHS